MRRLLLVLAITAFVVAVVLPGFGLTQEIPPTQAGPEKGCEGIRSANDAQEEAALPEEANVKATSPGEAHPSQGDENSVTEEVGNAHLCKLEGPPPEPGQSGKR